MGQRPERACCQRKTQRVSKNTRRCAHTWEMPIQTPGPTTHLPGWPKSSPWPHKTLLRMRSNGTCRPLLLGTPDGAAILGGTQRNIASVVFTQGVEDFCPHGNLHVAVHSSCARNRQHLRAAARPFRRWVVNCGPFGTEASKLCSREHPRRRITTCCVIRTL